jgi:hypothetical protein
MPMIEVRVLSAQDAAEFQRLRLEALRDSPTAFSSWVTCVGASLTRGVDMTFAVNEVTTLF